MITAKLKYTGLTIFGIVFLGGFCSAYAQVEVDLDVLENYQPPPMFGEAQPVRTEPEIKKQVHETQAGERHLPPIPQQKPVNTQSYIFEKEEMLEHDDLIEPTVLDILKQIDTGEPEQTAPAKPKPPEKNAEIETIHSSPLSVDDSKQISLYFIPGAFELTEEQKPTLIEQALVKATRNAQGQIEVQGFAAESQESISAARRLSLLRALEVRDFLIEHGIDPKRVNIRPLGSQTSITPADRVDIIFLQ